MKKDIEIETPEQSVEPFVFDRSNQSVQSLLKAGIPESRLKALDADYRAAADEVGEPVPPTGADLLVEKRR